MEPTKREFRQLKREIKQAGSQHRRRQWKRDLRDNPEEAPYSEDRFGRFSTAELNGNDKPRVRLKASHEDSPSTDHDEAVEPSDLADQGLLDLVRSRQVEQDVLDLLDDRAGR